MKAPSRARLAGVIISYMSQEPSGIKRTALEEGPVVSVSFDLWMLPGAQDIFSFFAFFCDLQLRLKPFYCALVHMCGTEGQSGRNQLEKALCESKIQICCVGYV